MTTDNWIQFGMFLILCLGMYFSFKKTSKNSVDEAIKKAVSETQQYGTLKTEVDLLKQRVEFTYNSNGQELKEIKKLLTDLSKRIDSHIDHS